MLLLTAPGFTAHPTRQHRPADPAPEPDIGVNVMIEAEVLNQIEAQLADLAARSQDIRGYL